MKKSLKLRIISMIMTVIMLLQIIPLSSLAVEFDEMSSNNTETTNPSTNELYVRCEVVDEREEYSKVFLLSDGSFYRITTINPLHTMSNNEWVDNYEEFENADSIEDVKSAIAIVNSDTSIAAVPATASLDGNITSSTTSTTIGYLYGSSSCGITDYPSHEIEPGDGAISITANSITPFINKNKAINYVNLVFSRADVDNAVNSEVTLYEGTTASVTSSNIESLSKIDKITVNAIGEYSIDVTNLYSKWDLGEVENNGIVLQAKGNDFLTLCNIYFEEFYDEVDLNDSDYTYRTFDLGQIGALYINNYTNTTLLEHKLFKLNSKVLPVYVSRINDSANPVITNSAGFGFTWNIESTISVSEDLAKWKTISLENKYFVPDETPIINDDYQVWKEVNSKGESLEYEDQNSVYFYIPNADIQSDTINYSNVYIKHGDTEYYFDDEGRLISVQRPGINNVKLSVDMVYDESGNLDYITDENNVVYNFDYSYVSDLRKSYLWRVWIDQELILVLGTHTATGELSDGFPAVYNHIHFPPYDDDTYEQDFLRTDRLGNILDVNDLGDNLYEIEYVNMGTRDRGLGNRVKSIFICSLVDGTDNEYRPTDELVFESPNNNYRKNILQKYSTKELINTEIIQYDKKHRVITHKDLDDNFTCVEYDENGVVSSYAFNEGETNNILNNSFESSSGEGIPLNWTVPENFELSNSTWENDEHGDYEISVSIENINNMSVSQTVTGEFIADNTYVVGAWIKVDETLPIDERKIGVQVYAVSNDNSKTEVCFGTIDNGLDREWQYRLQAFKLTEDYSTLEINLTAINQCGEIRFDEVTLFEAVDSDADLIGVNLSSTVEYTYDNGILCGESITNGIYSLNKSVEYYDDGSVSRITDVNGLDTYYSYFYDESSSITSIGTIRDSEGNILDITNVEYDAIGFLSKITQTISTLSEDADSDEFVTSDMTLSTKYNWVDEGQIESVEHNGVLYEFSYNTKGKITSISASTDTDLTNNSDNEIIYDDKQSLVGYTYINNNYLGTITYSNGYEIKYSYKSGKIQTVKCYYDEELIATYTYTYTASIISSITCTDSEGTCTVNYDENFIVNSIAVNGTELYSKGIDENGYVVETFAQAYFTGTNNTETDVITTSDTIATSLDSSNGDITNSSTIVVNKNASENKYSTITYERSSVTDYFNRIANKKTQLVYESDNEDETIYNVEVNTNYEYKLLDVGVTSGLVSKYETSVIGDEGVADSELLEYFSYSRNYEYDHKGNIKYVYLLTNSIETPYEYYEYDEANQLIASIDFIHNEVVRYIYDEGGNLTDKIFYDYSTMQFDYENRVVTNWGTKDHSVIYEFNNESDTTEFGSYGTYNMIKSIEEVDHTATSDDYESTTTEISYDILGNPLTYKGVDIDNTTISGNLSWNGYNLYKFDNEDMTIEYQYDDNGNRSRKIVYNKNDDGTTTFVYKMIYVWDGDVLTNLIYQGGDTEEVNMNIIYDQEGTPAGYVTSLGMPYYFIKDINENVIGLVHPNGSMLFSISYDVWGKPSYTYYGDNLLTKLIAKATAVFNPITYHGYIYDYETGMYCAKGRCYSPSLGRYINADNPSTLNERTNSVLDTNLYLFSNNNPINNIDTCAMWSRDYFELGWDSEFFSVEASDLFASRAFCIIFANQFVEENGEWSADIGYNYNGMSAFQIATALFSHYVGKNAPQAIYKVNASWGDDWLLECQEAEYIEIFFADESAEYSWRNNAWKYEKIWYAAEEIKKYAWDYGVHIAI